jgi:hypothetical protein
MSVAGNGTGCPGPVIRQTGIEYLRRDQAGIDLKAAENRARVAKFAARDQANNWIERRERPPQNQKDSG